MTIDLSTSFEWLAIEYQQTNMEPLLVDISDIQQRLQADVIAQFSEKYDIDTADGVWLDYVGFRLGIFTRPALPNDPGIYFGFDLAGTGFDQANFVSDSSDTLALDDADFRAFLKVIAQQLITDCTPENIRQSLLLFFDEVLIVDGQDMNMIVTIITSREFNIVQSVINSGIITKPAAVRIQGQIIFDEYFGFASGDGTGFDQASFVFQGEISG